MKCDVVFDYISIHNGEYWYQCRTCGARDWFSYSSAPRNDAPIANCVAKTVQELTPTTKQLVIQAYQRGYADAMDAVTSLPKNIKVTIEQALKQ